MSSLLWGVDLGGTKIEGVVFDPNNQKPVVRTRIDTQASEGYDHILHRVSELVALLETEHGSRRPPRIGIGTPGARRPNGRMKNCNTTCLNDKTLFEDLATVLGSEVIGANDADCFALAEAVLGAGRGHDSVFGIIMGTGVGGGIVVRGRLLSGPNGLTGEWGHNVLHPGGNICYCGQHGCVETYLAGPWVERSHFERTGHALKLREISKLAESDPDCRDTIMELCDNFGQALATVVNVLDPSIILLGGGVGQIPQLRTWGAASLRQNVFGPDFETPIVLPLLGDSAGVFGAALLSTNCVAS